MRRRWPPVRGCARGGSTETAMQTAGTTTLCRANCGGGVCRRTASHGRDNCGSVRGCVALVLRHVAHAGGRPTVAGPARHLTSLGGRSGVLVAWLRPRRGAVVAQRFLHPVAQGAAPRRRTPSLRRWWEAGGTWPLLVWLRTSTEAAGGVGGGGRQACWHAASWCGVSASPRSINGGKETGFGGRRSV